MNAKPEEFTVQVILKLRKEHMLVVNQEYQRGAVWTSGQRKRLVDSLLRGYPIPLIYFHHIRQEAGPLVSQRFEIIDGQQRINSIAEYCEGAFKLFDPAKDHAEARFPEFIKRQHCPWGGKRFQDLPDPLKEKLLATPLNVVKIETHDSNEARDLFVRLQSGMPLTSQEKRDAWPGEFTDFVLNLAGKPGIARYPGHDFFNEAMGAARMKDRGKFRQLAAQIAMLLITRRRSPSAQFCDINAKAIDDFYYENLDFDQSCSEAVRLREVCDKVAALLRDRTRKKIIGHEAIHLTLLIDSLLDGYTCSWEDQFPHAFDQFREDLLKAKQTRNQSQPGEHWLRYGLLTRVNADRGLSIQLRHEFFCDKMRGMLKPVPKDPARQYGPLERELIYYRDGKKCGACDGTVLWDDVEVHHILPHSMGGLTSLENGALVHKGCHPKTESDVRAFAENWRRKRSKHLDRIYDYMRAKTRQVGSTVEPMGSDDEDTVAVDNGGTDDDNSDSE